MIISPKPFTMKAIKFNEAELEFLQSHYELELIDAENYVGEIKNILKKLGVFEKEIAKEKPVKKSGKKPGRPKKEKTPVVETVATPVVKPGKKTAPKKVAKKVVKKVTKKEKKPVVVAAQAQPE
jgi:hypothetical protein